MTAAASVSIVGAKRSLDDSLCGAPVDPPRSFHYCRVSPDTSVRNEIVDAIWATGRPATVVAGLIGDIHARMRFAARGRLRDGDLLEPVRLDPALWEIKWRMRREGEFRLYHAEPNGDPALVALRFHRKSTEGNADAIRGAQEEEMTLAGARYAEGAKNSWGHARRCTQCLAVID